MPTLSGATNSPNSSTATLTVGASATAIALNNPAIVYSPYNWTPPTSAEADTICAGAYLRTLFTGTTCTLSFNVSNNGSPLSEIWYRIDGEGPWTQSYVASTISCNMPASTLSNADVPYHLLEVQVKSTSETLTRWGATSATAVRFTGLTLDAGATVAAPAVSPASLMFCGDSITEGVRMLGQSATNDTDRNDGRLGWAARLGDLLGGEYGVVGYGGSGLTVTGSGGVPA